MHKLMKENDNSNIPIYEHICESVEDLDTIPKDQINFGSIAIVLEETAVSFYMANSKKKWIKL